MALPQRDLTAVRRVALREGLLATVELLKLRHADQIAEDDIEDYVTLDWLEWNGGGLRLTTVGRNVCSQLTSGVG
ncbi:hypothetical protein [Rivibacter subsaxonicus]|uniref:Uncharacterized protein n=1 Tax=Rivibacter subsaxonicus TaxID=457575 RepID=A0A4V2FU88_9BURK|nr:hypothetical protein [Rivibacter subsaxonicus]RZU01056.1 hypothetical protein EV670_1770 [Rivibacter subsaxonicus]